MPAAWIARAQGVSHVVGMWRGDQAGEASRRRSKSAEQRATKVTPPQRRMSGGGPRRPGSGAYHPGAWRDLHGVARQILAAAPEQEVVRINLQHPTSLFSPSQSSAEAFFSVAAWLFRGVVTALACFGAPGPGVGSGVVDGRKRPCLRNKRRRCASWPS